MLVLEPVTGEVEEQEVVALDVREEALHGLGDLAGGAVDDRSHLEVAASRISSTRPSAAASSLGESSRPSASSS